MKLRDAAILYRPGGDCQVAHHSHESAQQRTLPCSCGAVYSEVGDYPPARAREFVLAEAIRLMVEQGIAPEDVHEAFLVIDEYRDALRHNMPGIQARPTSLHS